MDTASLTRESIAQNRLLAALPEADCARLEPYLELVALPLGSAVYESGGTQGHMDFPRTAVVSLLYVLEDGAPARVGIVGKEGVGRISLFLGGETTPGP